MGYNAPNAGATAGVLASIEGKFTVVWAYIGGKWKMADPGHPMLSDLTEMGPGYGYWIKATQSCPWTVNPSPANVQGRADRKAK